MSHSWASLQNIFSPGKILLEGKCNPFHFFLVGMNTASVPLVHIFHFLGIKYPWMRRTQKSPRERRLLGMSQVAVTSLPWLICLSALWFQFLAQNNHGSSRQASSRLLSHHLSCRNEISNILCHGPVISVGVSLSILHGTWFLVQNMGQGWARHTGRHRIVKHQCAPYYSWNNQIFFNKSGSLRVKVLL